MDFTPSFLNTLCINSTKGGEGEKRKILNSETKMTFQSQIAPLTHNCRDRKCTKCATAVFLNLWPGRDLKFASKKLLSDKIFGATHDFPDNKITITVSGEMSANQFPASQCQKIPNLASEWMRINFFACFVKTAEIDFRNSLGRFLLELKWFIVV